MSALSDPNQSLPCVHVSLFPLVCAHEGRWRGGGKWNKSMCGEERRGSEHPEKERGYTLMLTNSGGGSTRMLGWE